MVIRTITSLRDYVMDFDLGVQFEEDLGPVDGRKCQVRSPKQCSLTSGLGCTTSSGTCSAFDSQTS